MSAKNLDVHSRPLLLISLALLALSVVRVADVHNNLALDALVRPAFNVARTSNGLTTITPNQPETNEQPGMINEIPADPGSMSEANRAGRSLMLQMAVDQTVDRINRPVPTKRTIR